MGLLQARLTARRYRVTGELSDGFRDAYRAQIESFSFREPPTIDKREIEGWTLIDDVTGTDFEDLNRWLVDSWLLLGLRTDKRIIPSKVFRATLKRQCQAWADERGVSRCPSSVRQELKDRLEIEFLRQSMPRTQHHELAWNLDTDVAYFTATGDAASDRLRKRFFRTFGRKLVPFSPLEWAREEPGMVDGLISSQPISSGVPSAALDDGRDDDGGNEE